MRQGSNQRSDQALFLPDFCAIPTVFAVVLMGEVLAFVLVLAPLAGGAFWHELALTSLFVQWVGLASTASLCAARRWLARLGPLGSAVYAYLLILLLTVGASLAAWWLMGRGAPGALRAGPWAWELVARNTAISAIVAAVVLRYFYVQHQWKRNLEREAQSRVQALQSRIRPHFLFNSMNTIASLTRSRPELAERVVEDLAELFRVSLGDARVPVTLERELEVCRRYLDIETLRMGERLRSEWDLGEMPADALLPALTLQPLLENAVYHGVESCAEGGVIRVRIRREDALVRVQVSNTVCEQRRAAHREGNRMARDNVAERLDAFFASRAGLEASEDNAEYRIRLWFPYRRAR